MPNLALHTSTAQLYISEHKHIFSLAWNHPIHARKPFVLQLTSSRSRFWPSWQIAGTRC